MGTRPHETTEDLPNPSVEEIDQREAFPLVTVPVKPTGPVPVHLMPARKAGMFTMVLTTTPQRILSGPDPKRKRVLLVGDGDYYIATSSNAGAGARMHGAAGVAYPIELTYDGMIYASAVTGTVNLGVIAEYWAD